MLRKIHGTNFFHIKFLGRTYIKCQNAPVLPPTQVFYFNGQAIINENVLPVHIRPRGVVDERELQQRAEHKREADASPHVDGLGVGHGWQRGVDAGRLSGHGQQGGHTWTSKVHIYAVFHRGWEIHCYNP
jgi:hypothetical protein